MNKSEQINELAAALVKFHAIATNPKKNAVNPFLKSKYADLAEVINVSRIPLAECGLAIMQFESFSNGVATVETMLTHASGQWVSSELSIPTPKTDAQSIGVALTYARRYGWTAICGLAQDDDDGQGISGKEQPPQVQKQPYTLEMAQANLESWVNLKLDPERLFKNIRTKHTLSPDVEQFIKVALQPGG